MTVQGLAQGMSIAQIIAAGAAPASTPITAGTALADVTYLTRVCISRTIGA